MFRLNEIQRQAIPANEMVSPLTNTAESGYPAYKEMEVSAEMTVLTLIILSLLLMATPLQAQMMEQGFREEFNSLDDWKPLTFPKIQRHTVYRIDKEDAINILVAEANASASGIICTKTFNIYKTPVIKWKWKVSNIYQTGDAKKKSGDD